MQLTNNNDVKWFARKRYYVTLLTICGWFVATVLRSNLSVAIINMTSKRKLTNLSGTYEEEAEFNWNSMEEGILLSSFSWGYVLSPIGGILTNKLGGSAIFGFGLVATAIFTIITPVLARLNILVFIVCRILEGFAEGVSTASVVDIFLYWAPPNEKSRLLSVCYMGFFVAPGVANPFCGYIVQNYGWEAVFFITGGITILWSFFWFAFVSRSPTCDRFILATEKKYLMDAINIPIKTEVVCPWMEILKSKAVWALLNERFVEAWGISFLHTYLPIFVNDLQVGDINDIGIISGIPHFAVIFGIGISSYFCDYLRKNKNDFSKVHKIVIGVSHIFCIITLLTLMMVMDLTGIIICLSALKFFQGCIIATCGLIPIDIGQRHSGFINGLTGTFFAVGCIVNPIIIALMVPQHTVEEWKIYFVFLCGMTVYGCVVFLLYGSGALQPWATANENVIAPSKKEEVTIENNQEKATRF